MGAILEIRNLSIALPRGGDRSHAVTGVNLTVARSGDVACFNFNFKESAVTEASVAALRQLFAESLDELDATL